MYISMLPSDLLCCMLMYVCFLVYICFEHKFVGPEFDPTSPAFVSVSYSADAHGRFAPQKVIGIPSLGREVVDTISSSSLG